MTQATYDSARKSTSYSLTGSDRIATHNSSTDEPVFFKYPRSNGKYWDEIEFTSGSSVEANGFGMGNASAATNTYLGVDTNSFLIFEDATRGTWIPYYNNAAGTTIKTGGPQVATGDVLIICNNVDIKMVFLGIQKASTGSVQWITGNPNTSITSGGYDYSAITGTVTPAFEALYSGVVTTLRAVGSFTATADKPSGVTSGWDDATSGTTYNKNLSVSHVSTVTRTRAISFTKAISHVATVTRNRAISLRKAVAAVHTVTKQVSYVFLISKSFSHTSAVTLRKQVGKSFAVAATYAVTRIRNISLRKAISHTATVTKIVGLVNRMTRNVSHVATSALTGKTYIPAGSIPTVSVLWGKLRLGLGF